MIRMKRNMFAKSVLACVAVYVFAATSSMIVAQDAKTVLMTVAKAMGAENLRTIYLAGSGSNAAPIGQNRNPKMAWPVIRVKAYTRQIDFETGRSQVQMVRVQNGTDETRNEYIASDSPWNSQFGYWITPVGFIKGALANNATVSSAKLDGMQYTVVTFTVQNKYKVVGYINDKNLIERVQTWIDNDVLGDTPAEAWYSDYKDFEGLKFPTLIVEKQGGFPVTILFVSSVKPNGAVNITPPAAPANTVAQTASVQSEKVADGVYYLKGGTHHSVAVEFSDHIVLIEAPLNEARSLALIGEVKKLMPNKPIRYVVNTHHHFDHSGGLRTLVDEGATIITHETNSEFFARAFSAPRTLNPDRLARSGKKPVIESFTDQKSLSDSVRTLELHLIRDNPHHEGILMAFLPKEKILIEADVYTPSNAANPANRNAINIVDNVERLKLDYETILPLHGPAKAARTDLYAAIGKPARDMKDILAAKPANAQAAAAPAGRQILDRTCTVCHNLNRVENKKLNQVDWRTIVTRMKDRGAEISDTDLDVVLEYLVKTYGPQ
jgi:glyoxylase-like metal-dependent hydrolase (beta-lactamase superfamily II)